MSKYYLLLALVASFIFVASAQDDLSTDGFGFGQPPSQWMCPPVGRANGQPVSCSTATWIPSANCCGRCCVSNGNCGDNTCKAAFNLDEDSCETDECVQRITCNIVGDWTPGKWSWGRIKCKNPHDCNGHSDDDLCIPNRDGHHHKICHHHRSSSSSTGPESFVVGDPQFVGLRGQSFQIHGVAGEIYNIVSDVDLQYNSRFVFLDHGDCPVVNGVKQKGCFAHPGSYLGELGLKTRFGDKIRYDSGAAANGFAAVELNGKQLEIGEVVHLSGDAGFVSLNSTHLSTIQIGNWHFDFENSDMFINQRVAVNSPSKIRSHGLLGQTWKTTTYANSIKHIQGEVDDYVIRSKEVFGDDFVFNRFN